VVSRNCQFRGTQEIAMKAMKKMASTEPKNSVTAPTLATDLAQHHADGDRHQQDHQRGDDVLARDLEIERGGIDQQSTMRNEDHAEHGRGHRHQHRQREVALGEIGEDVRCRAARHAGHDQEPERNRLRQARSTVISKADERHEAVLRDHADGEAVGPAQGK
jgi:hypothetical protein